ncbi:MAG: GGDEF domain-containing phosphodiesterase [Clostridia bacterium]
MIEYNLTAEYAAPFLILIIFVTFINDFEEKTFSNYCLKGLYCVTLFGSIALTSSIIIGLPPTDGLANVTLIYVTNTLYLLTSPLPSGFYLALCILMTARKTNVKELLKKILPCFIPYTIYAIFILVNVGNGVVSSATAEQGYMRGQYYLIPFAIVGIHILITAIIVFKNRRYIHKEIFVVVVINMLLASSLVITQALNSHIILTSVGNIASILALHLYTLSKKSHISQLTGCKNKLALYSACEKLISKEEYFAIYVVSLRDFKSINERNGLSFGDKVLKTVANEIMTFFSYEEVYSHDGDEFAILLKENENNDDLIQECIKRLHVPFNVEDIELIQLDFVCAKVDNRYSGSTVKELSAAIDYSISLLKQNHGDPHYLYDVNIVDEMMRRDNMIQQIKDAIDHRMFRLTYQPIYSTEKKCFDQAEALVRMLDKDGNIVPPSEFIEIAETTGLVLPMTYIILDIACQDFRYLMDTYGDDLTLKSISINIPYHFFLGDDAQDKIFEILERHDIKTDCIKIEITERTLVSDSKFMLKTMEDMQKKGFIFELDDFGVDYSNMSTLLNLPLDIIKIDRNVLLSAFKQPENMTFFKHLVYGINDTEKVIVIEGIEEREQLDFILECGCQYVQGYIFSKPLFLDDFANFLIPSSQNELLKSFDLVS